jgi:hypothetical protein
VAQSKSGRATAADIVAAVKVGAIAPDAVVLTEDDLLAERAEQAAHGQPTEVAVPLSATEHECGIPGCRHGAAHTGIVQKDRQVKLQCPGCGAVARMTASAIARTVNGIRCAGDGELFAEATRRTYTRKVAQ